MLKIFKRALHISIRKFQHRSDQLVGCLEFTGRLKIQNLVDVLKRFIPVLRWRHESALRFLERLNDIPHFLKQSRVFAFILNEKKKSRKEEGVEHGARSRRGYAGCADS